MVSWQIFTDKGTLSDNAYKFCLFHSSYHKEISQSIIHSLVQAGVDHWFPVVDILHSTPAKYSFSLALNQRGITIFVFPKYYRMAQDYNILVEQSTPVISDFQLLIYYIQQRLITHFAVFKSENYHNCFRSIIPFLFWYKFTIFRVELETSGQNKLFGSKF